MGRTPRRVAGRSLSHDQQADGDRAQEPDRRHHALLPEGAGRSESPITRKRLRLAHNPQRRPTLAYSGPITDRPRKLPHILAGILYAAALFALNFRGGGQYPPSSERGGEF